MNTVMDDNKAGPGCVVDPRLATIQPNNYQNTNKKMFFSFFYIFFLFYDVVPVLNLLKSMQIQITDIFGPSRSEPALNLEFRS